MKLKTLDVIAAVLLVVGGLNWGLVSVAHFDLVAAIFGMKFAKLPHSVPSSTLWLAWRRCTKPSLSRPFSIAGDTSRRRLALVRVRTRKAGESTSAFSPTSLVMEIKAISLDPRITVRKP